MQFNYYESDDVKINCASCEEGKLLKRIFTVEHVGIERTGFV
jgi:hypothetical protein